MPRVVLLAKTVLVWLDQLSKKYGRTISHLDHIPDEELDTLERRGFTGLWLIGLWERSQASKRIKQINGNAEAAASAYSLYDYDIAHSLGGWEALNNLRERLRRRGIRLAADMIPNHTGMDSKWMSEKPDLFMQSSYCPFPSYSFTGENLSSVNKLAIENVIDASRSWSLINTAQIALDYKTDHTLSGKKKSDYYIEPASVNVISNLGDSCSIKIFDPASMEKTLSGDETVVNIAEGTWSFQIFDGNSVVANGTLTAVRGKSTRLKINKGLPAPDISSKLIIFVKNAAKKYCPCKGRKPLLPRWRAAA